MNKHLVLLLLLMIPIFSFSQVDIPKEEFKDLTLSVDTVYNNAGFKHFVVVDRRKDKRRSGKVRIGLMNKPVTLVFSPSLEQQLNSIFEKTSLFTDTLSERTMVLAVDELFFSEQTSAISEQGLFTFSAEAFEKINDTYFKLGNLKTEYKNAKMDATADLLKTSASKMIKDVASFLEAKQSTDSKSYTYLEIEKKDSLEKAVIPLYAGMTYKDGIYKNWSSFANQTPDFEGKIVSKKNKIKSVEVTDQNGKLVPVSPAKIYAVVSNGRPFITFNYKYVPIYRIDDDFQFIGKIAQNGNAAVAFAGGFLFGLAGGVVFSGIKFNTPYLFSIEHTDGTFRVLKQIVTFEEETQFDPE